MSDCNERTVDVGRPLSEKPIKSVAICAGAGGTLLSGVDADVYFTGEMQHVRSDSSSVCTILTMTAARSTCSSCKRSIRYIM
jgi:hypothetical protein